MEQNAKTEKNKKPLVIVIVLLAILIVALAAVAAWAIWFRGNDDIILAPDYAPKETEGNAVPIPNSGSDSKLDVPEDGGGVGLEYTKEATISLTNKSAELYFANPARSNQDMVVQLVIQDVVIIQSGRLEPGNMVTKLDLLKDAEKQLSEGVYEGKYVVLFYEQGTGEKAILNTEIPITITVEK